MATVSPKNLIGPAQAVTSTPAVYVTNGSSSTFGIIRTILVDATTAGLTFTLALGADAAGTRVIAAVSITQNVPYLVNGWIITPTNSAHAIDVSGTGAGTQMLANVSGYESV